MVMNESGIIGIVITHGNLADELLNTVRLIVGEIHDCYALSGSDLCKEEVVDKIHNMIDNDGKRHIVLFVDYFGGSCCASGVQATRKLKNVKIISGVNLPMLLDFVTKQGRMGFEEIVDHLVHRGQESVRVIEF
jgi:mannose/fructose-specific phosphotransferase system component IIA